MRGIEDGLSGLFPAFFAVPSFLCVYVFVIDLSSVHVFSVMWNRDDSLVWLSKQINSISTLGVRCLESCLLRDM